MIIKVNHFDVGWTMFDHIENVEWNDQGKNPKTKILIESHRDVDKMWNDGVSVVFSNVEEDEYPFEAGFITYWKTGCHDPYRLSWRGHLYIMNDDGKTIESLYVPY